MTATIGVLHVSDPGCPWAWSAAPHHAVLHWRYGAQLEWRLALIGLAERAEDYDARGYTPLQRGARLPRLPPARHAVRHAAARAQHRHRARVPRDRRGAPARSRGRAARVPRAPARPLHHHRRVRHGRRDRRGARARAAARPASGDRSDRRPRDRGRLPGRPGARPDRRGQPDRVPGQGRRHGRRGPLHRAVAAVRAPRRAQARGGRIPARRGLRRRDRQPRPHARAAPAGRATSPRRWRRSRTR